MAAESARAYEQRRFRRTSTLIAAGIRTPTAREESCDCTIRELGVGGCLLETGEMMGVGRVVTVEMKLPDGLLRAVARVRYEYSGRDTTFRAGAEFISLFPEDRCRLTALVESSEK